MENTEVYDDVKDNDYAFEGKLYSILRYLKVRKAKRAEVEEVLRVLSCNLNFVILDLEEYIKGGPDDEHKQLREVMVTFLYRRKIRLSWHPQGCVAVQL